MLAGWVIFAESFLPTHKYGYETHKSANRHGYESRHAMYSIVYYRCIPKATLFRIMCDGYVTWNLARECALPRCLLDCLESLEVLKRES